MFSFNLTEEVHVQAYSLTDIFQTSRYQEEEVGGHLVAK